MLTLGSLFDGIAGFPLAATRAGIVPVWASEIEPFPIAVSKTHFPDMKHLGSVTDINGAEIEPVDIITFGSPCQDLSVAGKRAGMFRKFRCSVTLKHLREMATKGREFARFRRRQANATRSALFFHAIRIINEMKGATNGEYPTFAVWENVPGTFSSNGGGTSPPFSRRWLEERYYRLKSVGGQTQVLFLDPRDKRLGESLMHNFGESPNAVVESTLSQILEANVPEKYYLSREACLGILRRAEKRGKKLLGVLERALRKRAGISWPQDVQSTRAIKQRTHYALVKQNRPM